MTATFPVGGGATVGGITDVPGLQAALDQLQAAATAATDTELGAAVTTLQTSLGLKADAATAATDAELASGLGGKQDASSAATDTELASGLVGKQDAATAATDAELASAVATINAAAATDTELASAVSTLNSSLGLKQDASTAATDAEVGSAVATLNASIALKQDASTAATDAEVAGQVSGINAKFARQLDFYPEDYGAAGNAVLAAGVWTGTDDTTAVQQALDAAAAARGTLVLSRAYLCNAAPRTDRGGNAVIALPQAGSVLIRSIAAGAPSQQIPATFLNLGIDEAQGRLVTSRTTDSYSATFGPPSLLGGPTEEQYGTGLPPSRYVGIDNLLISLPANPKISGIDLVGHAGAVLRRTSVQAQGAGDGVFGTPTFPTAVYQFGIRMPAGGNYGICREEGTLVQGCYAGVIRHGSHTQVSTSTVQLAVVGHALIGGDGHGATLEHIMSEGCTYHIAGWSPTVGAQSNPAATPYRILGGKWDLEDFSGAFATTAHVLDANNQLFGELTYNHWNGLAVTEALTVNGAGNLDAQPITTVASYKRISTFTGTQAVRLAQTPRDGRLYLENDTGLQYQGINAFGGLWVAYNRLGIIPKTADQSVNNSVTLVNDAFLKFPILASERFFVELFLDIVGVSAVADFKAGWALPAGATVKWALAEDADGVAAAGTPIAMSTTTIVAGLMAGEVQVQMSAWILNSTTAGTAQFQWAQNTATVENVTVKAGSFMRLNKLS